MSENRKAKHDRRRPDLTPKGEILVEVTLTEDVWEQVVRKLRQYDGHSTRQAISAITASITLARHHATSGLTSGQAQGYIDTGLIEPPFDAPFETNIVEKILLDEVFVGDQPPFGSPSHEYPGFDPDVQYKRNRGE